MTLKFATVEVHRLTLAGIKAEAEEMVSNKKAAKVLTIVVSCVDLFAGGAV